MTIRSQPLYPIELWVRPKKAEFTRETAFGQSFSPRKTTGEPSNNLNNISRSAA
jgi:hypothetical protein